MCTFLYHWQILLFIFLNVWIKILYNTCEDQVIPITKGGLVKPGTLSPMDLNGKHREFTHEITPILKQFEKINADAIIAGDFNVDLIKVNDREVLVNSSIY